jgi:hypothetical protein
MLEDVKESHKEKRGTDAQHDAEDEGRRGSRETRLF